MRFSPVILAWLAGMASGQVYRTPSPGFIAHTGQLPEEVLWSYENLWFRHDSVSVADARAPLTIHFRGSNGFGAPALEERLPWRYHVYEGPNPATWRRNISHYAKVRTAPLYPGIETEWRYTPLRARLHLTVPPGTSLDAVRLELESTAPLALYPQMTGQVVVGGLADPITGRGDAFFLFTFDAPVAHQVVGGGERSVAVRYETSDGRHLRLSATGHDPTIPLVVELPLAAQARTQGFSSVIATDGAGNVYLQGSKLAPDGTPIYLARFGGLDGASFQPGQSGNAYLFGVARDGFPTTPGAPQTAFGGGLFDGVLAKLDPDGMLEAATYVGGPGSHGLSGTVAPDGAMVFGGYGSDVRTTRGALQETPAGDGGFLGKWVPGQSQFRFVTYTPAAPSRLGVDGESNITYTGWGGDLPTTPGAFKTRYDGAQNFYVARVSAAGDRLLWATYLPVTGHLDGSAAQVAGLEVERSGDAWIAASHTVRGGQANVLVKLARDGSRVLHAQALPYTPRSLALDREGNVSLIGSTDLGNLPTAADALLRGPCDQQLYFQKQGPAGAYLYGTYLVGGFAEWQIDPAGFLYAAEADGIRRVRMGPTAEPQLTCMVHTAGRLPQRVVAPGQLITLLGTKLGPLEAAVARLGADPLPNELAGIRVRVDGAPAGIVSAQYGLLTFQVPGTLSPNSNRPVTIAVEAGDRRLEIEALRVLPSYFLLFTADGNGRGPAAVIGSAAPGTIVQAFGTGDGGMPVAVRVNGVPAEVLYSGPAPGLPGVTQVNFKVPETTTRGTALVTVFTGQNQGFPWPRVSLEIPR